MGIRMSVARCCCDVAYLVFGENCLSYNTEGSYTFDSMPSVSGTMPLGFTRDFVSLSEPYRNHTSFIERSHNASFSGSCNTEMEIGPIANSGGFKMTAKGLSSQTPATVGDNYASVKLLPDIKLRNPALSSSGYVGDRYNNLLSFPMGARDLVMETTINVTSLPPTYRSGFSSSDYQQFGRIVFGLSNRPAQFVITDGYLCFSGNSTLNYNLPFYSRLTVGGSDLSVTAPFSITIRKPSSDNGTVHSDGNPIYDMEILVDGVLTDQTFEHFPRFCEFVDVSTWTTEISVPEQVGFGSPPSLTTSDMVLEISSVEYLIGSGESVVTTPTFTVDSPWTESSGTITCDNSLVTSSVGNPFPGLSLWYDDVSDDKKATASVSLTNDTLHRIKFVCTAIDPAPVAPENGTETQPVILINGTVISSYRGTSRLNTRRSNPETQDYFFISSASGNTEITFYGFKETEYTISDIEIYEIPA